MVSMTIFPDEKISSQFKVAETIVKDPLPRSSFKRQRSERPSSTMKKHLPPLNLRRSKSMPAHLQESEYTGKPLFWFRRKNHHQQDKVPHQNLPIPKIPSSSSSSSNGSDVRPPRPLMRFLGAPLRKMRQSRSSIEQPYLQPEERNDSFETLTTVMDEYLEDFDETLVDYSDDEDDYLDDEDETLHGLSFLEEERE